MGLAVGHPETRVEKILVALEATPEVVAEAVGREAQLLLTHHPLLYQPVTEVREDRPSGQLLAAVIRAGLSLVSCHTNLDVAPGGLNDYLAQILGLGQVEVLSETARDSWCKLAVMVPVGYEERLLKTLGDAGLGVIGRYSHCSFAVRGQGTYRPLEGARPFKGEVAKLSRVDEARLEVLVPESRLTAAVALVKEAHPYEEPAYDLYPLKNPGVTLGFGRLGRWPKLKPFPKVVSLIKKLFGVKMVKVWGQPPGQVERVAVCGGSGGDLLAAALSQGAQVYVTGEVRHHQVPAGSLKDFAVLEVGHFASEVVYMEPWAAQLRGLLNEAGLAVQVEVALKQSAPCDYL